MKYVRKLIVVLLAGLVIGASLLGIDLWADYHKMPAPWEERCEARVTGEVVHVDLEQAHNASIITGVAWQRGLIPRASSIALATAYQESGLHNLAYGDRDSLGLFQQRPSQDWGTPEQVMDPHYAANAFYRVMEKQRDWQTRDLGDVAQAVQRSGYPDAYDRHVPNARRLASSLTGETPASFSCAMRSSAPADPEGLVTFLTKTLPADEVASTDGRTVTVKAANLRGTWQAAHTAVANAGRYGVTKVTVSSQTWTPSWLFPSTWQGPKDPDARTVVIELN